MNNEDTAKLAGIIDLLLASSARINEAKPQRYWYPLSMATYGTEEILEALDSLCSFRTTMWEKTIRFEETFAQYQGCEDAVMVNSGSSADLLLAFLLLNPLNPLVEPDSEILVPVVTWPTQIWSPMIAGLKVCLVDVDPLTLNINLNDLESKINDRTRAIFLVHLMGNPCNMDRILELAKQHNLIVLEDCCEALGAEWDGKKVGNFGLGGSFSFFFSHHITTMEGGMICCQNREFADHLRILRAHGWVRNVDSSRFLSESTNTDSRYSFVNWGFNLRPTDLQAGFGLEQIKRLPGFNQRRAELANVFFEFLAQHAQGYLLHPDVHAKATPAWFSIPLMVQPDAPFSSQDLMDYLEANGVETRPIVAGNLARQPAAKLFPAFKDGPFKGADEIHQCGFYIGLSPLTTDSNMEHLIDLFRRFVEKY
jgi:CDP-6-deoxy-D-xylo-4-hexulose-3-dehydrase